MQIVRTITVAVSLALAAPTMARAADAPMVLQWAQLVPLETAKPKAKKKPAK